MAGLQDLLARGQAAGGMMQQTPMEEPPTEEMAELPEAPQEEDALEAALAQVDAAVEGMDAAIAEQIRGHLNEIRDLASKEPGAEAPAEVDAAALPEAPPAEEKPPGGIV